MGGRSEVDEWGRGMNFDSASLVWLDFCERSFAKRSPSDFQVSEPDLWIWSLADRRFGRYTFK
jgi:hypothetical protein